MTTVGAILSRSWGNNNPHGALVRLLILAAICALPTSALAQELAAPAQSIQAGSLAAEGIFRLRPEAQEFKFSKADLDLLKQVDAFDKYIEDKGWVYSDPATDEYINRVGRMLVPPDTRVLSPVANPGWHVEPSPRESSSAVCHQGHPERGPRLQRRNQ